MMHDHTVSADALIVDTFESLQFDELLNFIEENFFPLDDIVTNDEITKEQISKLYLAIKNIDDLFRNIVQIYYFKKAISEYR